jgi:hypothetical protein
MSVAENITKIEERLIKALNRAGRKREEITLMGVSKFVPKELIKEAYEAGIYFFGESRVKEAAEKFSGFSDEFPGAKLHLIGSLQRNKAKQAVYTFDCIQSVDREELILELEKYESLRENELEVLLELRTGEETKSGFADIKTLLKAADLILDCDNLKPAGLMTMAPYTTDTDAIRSSFRLLFRAQKELEKHFPQENWSVLSMGMSNDFEIAVEEGSTMLRIGSAIFREE